MTVDKRHSAFTEGSSKIGYSRDSGPIVPPGVHDDKRPTLRGELTDKTGIAPNTNREPAIRRGGKGGD